MRRLNIALFVIGICAAVTYSATPVSLTINASGGKKSLFEVDIFLEANINRGDDGGLYAELIYNRAFQENGGSTIGWNGIGNTGLSLTTSTPLSWALPRSVTPSRPAGSNSTLGFYNTGWMNQLPVVAGWVYTASFWARSDASFPTGSLITIGLYDATLSTAYATATIHASLLTSVWAEYSVTLNPKVGAPFSHNVFAIILPNVAAQPQAWFNLISLFPPTFNNVPNGLRVDLAQALADIKPKYIRWPGGNDLEGLSIAQRFNWSATIGPLQYRPGRIGTWDGYATGGLGLTEVCNWAESVNIKPLLGIYAGYSLDGSAVPNTIALDPFIRDVLNELHFMLDPPESSQWSALRASYGRVSPYNLDTLEIGNEDNLGQGPSSYTYRFARFTEAITAEFPNHSFQFIATDSRTVANAPAVDIHDYVIVNDFIREYNRYDSYPRNTTKIYALEYAVLTGDYLNPDSTGLFSPAEVNNRYTYPELRGSVAEFIYAMGMERNGDIVKGAAYAPLFHNVPLARNQLWLPDLISFDATVTVRSTSYWIQWLLGNSPIDTILSVTTTASPGPLYWSAGRAATSTYILKLANVNNDTITTSFSFNGVVSGQYTAIVWTLSAPAGYNNTVANTINTPNLVTPKTSSLTSLAITGSVASGTVTVPGWSAVVVKISHV